MWLLIASLVGIFLVFVLPFLVVDWPIAVAIAVVLYFWPFRVAWVRRWWLWRRLRERLHYEVIDENGDRPEISPTEQLVFAVAPHGPLCFSMMLTWVFDNPDSPLVQKNREVIPMVSSQVLWVPVLGLLARLCGCQDISRDNFQTQLGRYKSIAMAPGGAREITFCDGDDATTITLHRHQRARWVEFIKYNNTNILPVLSVGEISGYRVYQSWRPLQRLSYVLTGWPFPMFFFGTLGTFWPREGRLQLVVGRKILHSDYETFEAMAEAYYAEIERLAEARGITINYAR